MIVRLLALGFLLAGAGCVTMRSSSTGEQTTVMVQQGRLKGAMVDGVVAFKGVPYAAPPVASLRWKPPQPPSKWEGLRSATEFGPPCPSIDGSKIAQGRRVVGGGADVFIGVPLAARSNEDCLQLNIWAPVDATHAAVMVWLQPLGASSLPFFDGAAFARDGVVMVTLEFRQLTFGNFAHPALTNEAKPDQPLARFQTMDQMAALRWVKQNIAAFGGDAGNVTVFGESASAASTLQLLTIPGARGLVDKAIVQSGAGWWNPFSLSQMERMGSLLATQAGLRGKEATAEQLRALAADKLPQLGVYSVDGRMEPENGTRVMDAGRLADVPLLIGWTDFDGSSLRSMSAEEVAKQASDELKAAYVSDGKSGADLGYQMYTDSHVGGPARWIAGKASGGAPSYLYLFSYVRTQNRGKVRGAAHGDDVTFVFDNWQKAAPELQLSEEDRVATRMMHTCWVSFAKTGKPSCDGVPDWPRYTPQGDQLMELGLKPQVRQHFRKPQLDAQEKAWRAGADKAEKDVENALRRLEESQLRPTN